MNKNNLDFEKTLEEKLNLLENTPAVVLSTCSKNQVTSRVVDIACCDRAVYFLTWSHHTKCIQMMENPKVAMCHNNLQIEGLAEIKGNPFLKSNKVYSEKYREKQPKLYDRFVKFKGMVIVKVDITSIHSYEGWDDENKGFFTSIINIPDKTALRVNLED